MFPLSQKVKMVIYVKSYNCDSTILHNDKAKYLEYVCRSELGFRLFVGGGGSALYTLFTLVGVTMQSDVMTFVFTHPHLIFIYLRLLIARLMTSTVTMGATMTLGSPALLLLQPFVFLV